MLGDRIAIMSQGSLNCCGSPLFLKNKFGSGYNLILTRKRTNPNSHLASRPYDESKSKSASDDQLTGKIIEMVSRIIPSSSLNSNINSEISFKLPTEEANKFPELFIEIERRKEELGVFNAGISVASVEEVFLR